MEATGAARAPDDGTDRSPRARLRGWLRVSSGERDTAATEQVEELERELAILREENARLKVAREHAGDRPVNERVRAAFLALRGEEDPTGDGPWEVLTECMLLRDGLVDACRELERGAAELRARLETLLPDVKAPVVELRPSEDFEGVV